MTIPVEWAGSILRAQAFLVNNEVGDIDIEVKNPLTGVERWEEHPRFQQMTVQYRRQGDQGWIDALTKAGGVARVVESDSGFGFVCLCVCVCVLCVCVLLY